MTTFKQTKNKTKKFINKLNLFFGIITEDLREYYKYK